MRIAIIEDDDVVRNMLADIIQGMGHLSASFNDGQAAMSGLLRETFDLVLLDWNMPEPDGLALLQWIQTALDEKPPVIMITARSDKPDIVKALNAGADDYITKPEDSAVISARIAAALRRSGGVIQAKPSFEYAPYVFNRTEQTVQYGDKIAALTAKEFDLAELLFHNLNRTLSRGYIMENIWRMKNNISTRTLDMHVSRLRTKLDLKPENGFRIHTVFGYGYRLEAVY